MSEYRTDETLRNMRRQVDHTYILLQFVAQITRVLPEVNNKTPIEKKKGVGRIHICQQTERR